MTPFRLAFRLTAPANHPWAGDRLSPVIVAELELTLLHIGRDVGIVSVVNMAGSDITWQSLKRT
jgi:hypothetical protein